MTNEKGRRLGRGLEALIPTARAPIEATPADPSGELRRLALSQIQPNPYQPRREFNEADLAELQASIGASGLLQPITVRRRGDGYELISGERRLKAVGRLGWVDVPAIIKEVDDRTLLTLALIENLQRADLTAVEEAIGYRRLIEDFGYTQLQVAEVIGKDRTTITNLLRILSLPEQVLAMVANGQLSAGHAKALLVIPAQRDVVAVATETVARQLSVREVERRARALQGGGPSNPPGKSAAGGPLPNKAHGPIENAPNAIIRKVEDDLRRRFQTDIHVKLSGAERGTIELDFYSSEDLERLLDLLIGAAREPY